MKKEEKKLSYEERAIVADFSFCYKFFDKTHDYFEKEEVVSLIKTINYSDDKQKQKIQNFLLQTIRDKFLNLACENKKIKDQKVISFLRNSIVGKINECRRGSKLKK